MIVVVERLMRRQQRRLSKVVVLQRCCFGIRHSSLVLDQNHKGSQLVIGRQLQVPPLSIWNNYTTSCVQDGRSIQLSHRPTIGFPQRQHFHFSSTDSSTTTHTATLQVENEWNPAAKNASTNSTKPHQLLDAKSTMNILERATEICNETIYPISAFADEKNNYRHFMMVYSDIINEAKRLVQCKYRLLSKNTTSGKNENLLGDDNEIGQVSDTINLAFQLLVRISREPWKTSNQKVPLQRYYKPQYTNMLLQIWNIAALQNEPNLLSAYDVTQLVKQISYKHMYSHNRFEQPRYDPNTITMLLQVAIHEARDILVAPPSMEQQLMFNDERPTYPPGSKILPLAVSNAIRNKPPPATSSKDLVVYLYNALVKAHAESGSNKAIDKTVKVIYDVMEEMRVKYFIPPNTITYNILLRFLRLSNSSSTSLERFQLAFQKMQMDQITPNISTCNEVVQCYTTTKKYAVNQQQLDIAEQYIKQMIDMTLKVRPVRDADAGSIRIRNDKNNDMQLQLYYADITLITNCAQRLMDAYAREFMKQPTTQQRQEFVNKAKGLFLLLDKDSIFSGSSTRKLYCKSVLSFFLIRLILIIFFYNICQPWKRATAWYNYGHAWTKWQCRGHKNDVNGHIASNQSLVRIYDPGVWRS